MNRVLRVLFAAASLLLSPVISAVPFPRFVDLEEARTEVRALESELSAAQEEHRAHSAEEQELDDRITAQKQRILKLEKALEDLQGRLSSLHRKQAGSPDRFERERMNTEIAEAEALRGRIIEEIQTAHTAIEDMEQKKKEAWRNRRIAEAVISRARERLPLLKAAIRRTEAEQAKLEVKMEEAEKALEDLDDILDEYAAE
ncbi:MAG: hypothetical protein JXB03_00030 [Spirochaetales bacterium]|nr:hypothetical protein [Spirochaetales bacterium]